MQAAEWAARRDLRALSSEEQGEFAAWLGSDIRHLGAYGRAEAVLARLERVHSGAVASDVAQPVIADADWTRRQVVWAGSAAASIATLGMIGKASWTYFVGKDMPPEERFATATGETREIVLADRSVMTLNTKSAATVRFSESLREVELLQGEALFKVVGNKKRPFVVTAGDTKVRAVGTSFTVSMLPVRPLKVLVKEGIVELQRTAMATPVRASANVQIIAPAGAPLATVAIPEAQVERELAWQYGKIAFDDQSLRWAADEFSRYSDIHIVVDPAVADRTVTGLFVSSDPVGFARTAAAILKLKTQVNDHEVRIFAS